jgi:hypothetical protein
MLGKRHAKAVRSVSGRLEFEMLEPRALMSATSLLPESASAVQSAMPSTTSSQVASIAMATAEVLSIEDWVHSLNESQYYLLAPDQVQYLTAGQLRGMQRPEYFKLWPDASQAALTASQVQLLDIDALGISQLNSQQIGALTISQIQATTFGEFDLLLPGQVPNLTAAQIQSIPHQGYLASWSTSARAALTKTQVQNLNIATIGVSLLTFQQIAWLTVPQIQSVWYSELNLLQPSQIPSLTAAQIQAIPHQGYLAAWSTLARAALTAPQVQNLNISTIGINLLTPQQIAWLTVPQIQATWYSQFELLQPSQIPNLTAGQIQAIPHKGYFSTWSAASRAALTASQIPNLNVSTIGIDLLTSQQIAWLTVPQIQSTGYAEFHLLQPWQIPFLTTAQIQSIPHQDYLDDWSVIARASLTKSQVQNLNIATIGISLLTVQQIAWLTAPQIQATWYSQFNLLQPWQVPFLSTVQIQSIPHRGYFEAWSELARSALTKLQLQNLNIGTIGLALLTPQQIGWLTPQQIQSIGYQDIPRLYASQIPTLTTQQIASIPSGTFLSDLPEVLQRSLTRTQILALPLKIWAEYGFEPTPPTNYVPVVDRMMGENGMPMLPFMVDEENRLMALVPSQAATNVAKSSGAWSNPATWSNGRVPTAGAKVFIPEGISVVFDSYMTQAIGTLRIDGTLAFAVDRNTQLKADTIVVSMMGALNIGTVDRPIQDNVSANVLIADNGPINTVWDPYLLSRGLISLGQVRMYGKTVTPYANLAVEPKTGDATLYLKEVPVNWQVGDTLVIAGTDDRAMNAGAEERTILAINGSVVTIEPLQRDHIAPAGIGATIQVANLARNVTFNAEDDSVIAERPHLMFMHNPDVELHNIGVYGYGRTDKSQSINDPRVVNGVLQPGTGTNVRARYAIHFHHAGVDPMMNPAIVEGSVVVGSPGWGYVNHQSNVNFVDNVAYGVYGASFVTEDGNEIGLMQDNLALSTLGAYGDVESRAANHDFGFNGNGFWLQGPGVAVVGNIAAGSRGAGFVVYMSSTKTLFDAINLDNPSLAGGQKAVPLGSVPFERFDHNTAYAANTGLDVWREGQVMTDGLTVFESFFGWNLWSYGVSFHYSGQLLLRNSRLFGDLEAYTGNAVDANFLCHDIYVENLYADGFNEGFHAPVRRAAAVNGGFIKAVVGVYVEKGHSDNRRIAVNHVQFGSLTAAQLQGRTQYDVYLTGPYDFTPYPARKPDSLFSEDRVMFTPYGTAVAIRLYYLEQAANFVPFPSAAASGFVPNEYLNKTNQQLRDLYGVVYRGGLVPANAYKLARMNGWGLAGFR